MSDAPAIVTPVADQEMRRIRRADRIPNLPQPDKITQVNNETTNVAIRPRKSPERENAAYNLRRAELFNEIDQISSQVKTAVNMSHSAETLLKESTPEQKQQAREEIVQSALKLASYQIADPYAGENQQTRPAAHRNGPPAPKKSQLEQAHYFLDPMRINLDRDESNTVTLSDHSPQIPVPLSSLPSKLSEIQPPSLTDRLLAIQQQLATTSTNDPIQLAPLNQPAPAESGSIPSNQDTSPDDTPEPSPLHQIEHNLGSLEAARNDIHKTIADLVNIITDHLPILSKEETPPPLLLQALEELANKLTEQQSFLDKLPNISGSAPDVTGTARPTTEQLDANDSLGIAEEVAAQPQAFRGAHYPPEPQSVAQLLF